MYFHMVSSATDINFKKSSLYFSKDGSVVYEMSISNVHFRPLKL